MSTNIDVHGVQSLRVHDAVYTESTVWRTISAYDKDGKVTSFTFYAPADVRSLTVMMGDENE